LVVVRPTAENICALLLEKVPKKTMHMRPVCRQFCLSSFLYFQFVSVFYPGRFVVCKVFTTFLQDLCILLFMVTLLC
jgi:hypothetical protein